MSNKTEVEIAPLEEPKGKIVIFQVSRGLSDEDKETVLHNIQTLSGIFMIAAIHPDAITEDKRNEYYAIVDEKADFSELIDDIRQSSGITLTWMPPQP